MVREKEAMRCGLCGKRINGRNGGVYCASCSRRLEAGESAGAIMPGAKDEELGPLDKAFLRYRNMDKAQLATIYKQSHKVSDLRGVSAKALVYDIMRDDFGNRRVDEWLRTQAKDVEPVGDVDTEVFTIAPGEWQLKLDGRVLPTVWNSKGAALAAIPVERARATKKAKDAPPYSQEDKRWKQHMHEDGLWCGDVNCKTCAKSGAMAKGVKEMKSVKDAEVKPVKYTAEAVQKEINKDKRIGGKEAKLIHALLKGRTGDARGQPTGLSREGAAIYTLAKERSISYAEAENLYAKGERPDGFSEHLVYKPKPAKRVKDASPFDVDTDAGAERIVKREAKAGLTAAQIARKHGFSLSFVKEVLGGAGKDSDTIASHVREAQRLMSKGLFAPAQAHLEYIGAHGDIDDRDWARGQIKKVKAERARDVKPVGDAPMWRATTKAGKILTQQFTKEQVMRELKHLGFSDASIAKLSIAQRSDDVKPVGDAKYSILKSDYMAAQSSGPRKPWFVKNGSMLIGGAAFATEEAAKKYIAYLEKSDRENAPRERREARQIKPAYTTLAEMQRAHEDPDSAYSLYAEGRISKALYEEASKKLRFR